MTAPRALLSSDWNQCLAPCGPFDCIAFHHPELRLPLEAVFREYTGNRLPLAVAVERIRGLLPDPLSAEQMDAYLKEAFTAYTGVPELIRWCRRQGVLFMINTTGMIGYFQRVFALGLLPPVAAISAHPMIRYAPSNTDPPMVYELLETTGKGPNTEREARRNAIPAAGVIVMGDSGGDGPHFAWASRAGARRVASMTKPSLSAYCSREGIGIDRHFGPVYAEGEKADPRREMQADFQKLIPEIERLLAGSDM